MFASLVLFEGTMLHGQGYLQGLDILWLNVLPDSAIAIAYFSTPVMVTLFLRRSPDF